MNTTLSKNVILVLGMHRSGTSLLTRILNLHGITLAADLTNPNEFNEKGYWESKAAQKVNDFIFNELHTSWFDCFAVKLSEVPGTKMDLFRSKVQEYLETSFTERDCVFFAIKDPRISKLVPVWHDALESFDAKVSVIIPFRNPLEVARSLAKRDGLTERHGLALWLRYLLDAERYTRYLDRSFVSFDGLLRNWEESIQRVGDELGIEWPKSGAQTKTSVEGFLSTDLKHHSHTEDDISSFGLLGRLALQVYSMLQDTESGPQTSKGQVQFDAVSEQLDRILQKPEVIKPGIVGRHVSHQRHLKLVDVNDSIPLEFELSQLLMVAKLKLDFAEQKEGLKLELEKVQASQENLRSQLTELEKRYRFLEDELEGSHRKLEEAGELQTETSRLLKEERQVSSSLEKDLDAANSTLCETSQQLQKSSREYARQAYQNVLLSRKFEQLETETKDHQLATRQLQIGNSQAEATLEQLNLQIFDLKKQNKTQEKQLNLRFKDIAILTCETERLEEARLGKFQAKLESLARSVRGRLALLKNRSALRLIQESELFDQEWYLQRYPDVREQGVNPARHYFLSGAREGRSPGPRFDTYEYLLANPDVAVADINPLVHFLRYGSTENRQLRREQNEPVPKP